MARTVKDAVDNRRLRELIKKCDPEVTVLSLLIAQAQVGVDTYPRDLVHGRYRQDPTKLFGLAHLPSKIRTAWRNGDWEALAEYLGQGADGEVPTNRGWPT